MVYRWEMHSEHFQHQSNNELFLVISIEENCIVAIYRCFVFMIWGLRLKAISYILADWCSLLLFIISDSSAGSGRHLPRPPATASILQAARLCPPKPVWNGPVPAVWRQWYSLLVSNNHSLCRDFLRTIFPHYGWTFLVVDRNPKRGRS